MEDLLKNKLVWGIMVILSIIGWGFVSVDIVTNRVMQKLQKEYSPSPYGPGFNPDKVDPDFFKKP
jgi:hypothetical protein